MFLWGSHLDRLYGVLQGLVASKIHGACLEEGEDSKGFIS
uniref:Uncharacterized protein n=1 Tax=Physcomitrium patens TaxID=3218 RepID=A0A2K1K4B5_PHYPA|nr:hypothetical protein PHYPA_013094 [Physcomitrium patens]